MKQTCSLAVLALALLAAGLLPVGCGKSSNNSNPTSPSAPAGPPSYSLGTFFGKSGSAPMQGPHGIGVSGSTLWVANNNGSDLQAWTVAGSETLTLTAYGATSFSFPVPLGIGPDGFIYVGDSNNYQAVEVNPTGGYVTVFGSAQLGTDSPGGVAVNGSYAYLGDNTGKIFRYSIAGSGSTKTFSASATFGTSGSGTLGALLDGIGLDKGGNVYASDFLNGRVVKYDPSGNYLSAVTLLNSGTPSDVTVDNSGYLYAADNSNLEVQMFSPAGAPVTQWGNSFMQNPSGIALDAAGNLYVADAAADEVYLFQKN